MYICISRLSPMINTVAKTYGIYILSTASQTFGAKIFIRRLVCLPGPRTHICFEDKSSLENLAILDCLTRNLEIVWAPFGINSKMLLYFYNFI